MNLWELPASIQIDGMEYPIRTDFRAVLGILQFFYDPEANQEEKILFCLDTIYKNLDDIPEEKWGEAYIKAIQFIDMDDGPVEDKKPEPAVMDWEQDAGAIIPAINHVIGQEVRMLNYMHWWTFLGAYMEIGDGLFAQIVAIRSKKKKGKKLEKWEQEFYREHRDLIDLKKRYTKEELEEQERLQNILKGGK